MSEGDLTCTSATSGLATKTVPAAAVRRISVPLPTSSTIGAPLAGIWLAPPPRNGRAAFGDGAATMPRASGVGGTGSAASGATAKAKENIDPARPTSGKKFIEDLETRVATFYG